MFANGEALWAACVQYFEWVHNNPLYEDQVFTFQGVAGHEPVAKMRAMTKAGLCGFLGIERTTWSGWKRDRPDLGPTIEQVEVVIWDQKFSGAAAGLLNAGIVARELGLADKTELTGKDGTPIQTEELTPKRPSEDHMADMAERFLGAAMKHAPQVAAKVAARTGQRLPERAGKGVNGASSLAQPLTEDDEVILVDGRRR